MGCREATNIKAEEAILGFPGIITPTYSGKLDYLKKAIPRASTKRALKSLGKR